MDTPLFASALVTAPPSGSAEDDAVETLRAGLDGRTPDLVLAFATHHHGAALETLGPHLARATRCSVVLGCTGESVVGGGREVEGGPALSLWAACLPGTEVRPLHASAREGPHGGPEFSGWPVVMDPSRASLLLLADPFSFPAIAYLDALGERFEGLPVMGGMASGGEGPGQNLLFTRNGLQAGGAVGAVLEGDIELHSVVSQGCRPVGRPWVVTDCENQRFGVLLKLGGKPAADVLVATLQELEGREQQLFQQAPFVGLAVDATKSRFARGDFLVRQILQLDRDRRAVAVADRVRRGQTLQFLMRDADTAGEDLEDLLRDRGGGTLDEPGSAGALLFTCNGRGSRMFSTPDHDASRIRGAIHPELPLAGFFANGEIGPVGGRNFLHGFTASVAVFRARRDG